MENERSATLTDYDSWARDFEEFRRPSPIVLSSLKHLFDSVPDGNVVLSVGCGTGQYEQELSGLQIVGIDQSREMLRTARRRMFKCFQGNMLELPFADNTFRGAYFIQSLHHLGANFEITTEDRIKLRRAALREAWRVIDEGPMAIVQRDPSQNEAVWFWRYFPEALRGKLVIQPKIDEIVQWLDDTGFKDVKATPLHDPMIRGFFDPQGPLQAGFRHAFSEFAYLTKEQVDAGIQRLTRAIENGSVAEAIASCRNEFQRIGGTVFFVSATKRAQKVSAQPSGT